MKKYILLILLFILFIPLFSCDKEIPIEDNNDKQEETKDNNENIDNKEDDNGGSHQAELPWI